MNSRKRLYFAENNFYVWFVSVKNAEWKIHENVTTVNLCFKMCLSNGVQMFLAGAFEKVY